MLKNTLTKLRSKKGFTLMEMLIVVAIIAILVAIAIPTFNGALKNAKRSADLANFRAAKAVAAVNYMGVQSNDDTAPKDGGKYFDADTSTFVTAKSYTAQTDGKAPDTYKEGAAIKATDTGTVVWDPAT